MQPFQGGTSTQAATVVPLGHPRHSPPAPSLHAPRPTQQADVAPASPSPHAPPGHIATNCPAPPTCTTDPIGVPLTPPCAPLFPPPLSSTLAPIGTHYPPNMSDCPAPPANTPSHATAATQTTGILAHENHFQILSEEVISNALKDASGNRIEPLHKGGQGWVYRACIPDIGVVALKGVPGNLLREAYTEKGGGKLQASKDMVLKELLIMNTFSNKHIMRAIGMGFDTHAMHSPVLVMPWYPSTLRDVGRNPFKHNIRNSGGCFALLLQIANGIACLHLKHHVHRDIKPDNILCHQHEATKTCQATLADFGGVKYIHPHSAAAQLSGNDIRGTKWFMPPEAAVQGREKIAEYGLPGDVYAFGKTCEWFLRKARAADIICKFNTIGRALTYFDDICCQTDMKARPTIGQVIARLEMFSARTTAGRE